MNAQQILQMLQRLNRPLQPRETTNILDGIRGDVRADLEKTLVDALTYYRARTLSRELELEIDGAQESSRTAAVRFNRLHQTVAAADLALRQAKADKIMLPGSASRSTLTAADQAIQQAERALEQARTNLEGAKTMAERRQQELENLRALHRALEGIELPDMTALRLLLDAVEQSSQV